MTTRPTAAPKASPLSCRDTDPSRDDPAAVFKALAHPVRVEIVSALACCAGACCGDIVRGLPLAQSTVSQHLSVLRAAGLVVMRDEGRSCRYVLADDARARIETAIAGLFGRGEQDCLHPLQVNAQARSRACRKDNA